jgi:L-fuculose-phosphate aldolase
MAAWSVENAHEAALATAEELLAEDLVEGTAGNVSARMPDGNVCITPSSVEYRAMTLEDLVVIDPKEEVVSGGRGPSAEKALHLACYEVFAEVGSVFDSHPVHATMFAVARPPIPACIDEFTVYARGDRLTEYAPSDIREVGDAAVACLASRRVPAHQPTAGPGASRAEGTRGNLEAPDLASIRTGRAARGRSVAAPLHRRW